MNNSVPKILDIARLDRINSAKKTVKRAAITVGITLVGIGVVSVAMDRWNEAIDEDPSELTD